MEINYRTVHTNIVHQIKVYGSLDNHYYPGLVNNVHEGGQHVFYYANGDEDQLVMKDKTWMFFNNRCTS